MTRPEIYEAMGKERIIMFDQLQARLEQLTDDELIARWRGTVDLAFDYSPENRPEWMSQVFWTPTALECGQRIIRKEQLRQKRARDARIKQAYLNNLRKKKLNFWLHCSNKRQLIENHLSLMTADPFYCKCVREQFLAESIDFDTLDQKLVSLWLWDALPPFKRLQPVPKFNETVPEAV